MTNECGWETCQKPRGGGGLLCYMHQSRKKKGQDMNAPSKFRPKGSGTITKHGYVRLYIPDHPNATSLGYVMEHTVVMSRLLGRPLMKHENVHHKNGNRADNREKNLELWSNHQPTGQRVEDLIEWAKEILRVYETNE